MAKIKVACFFSGTRCILSVLDCPGSKCLQMEVMRCSNSISISALQVSSRRHGGCGTRLWTTSSRTQVMSR